MIKSLQSLDEDCELEMSGPMKRREEERGARGERAAPKNKKWGSLLPLH